MSISLSQRPSGTSANPTRQQLDELDALLQRMMDLPVNKPDADGPTPPVSYTTPDEMDGPADELPAPKIDFQALKQRLAAQADRQAPAPPTAPADDANWVPLSSTWQPSSLTWKPLAQSLQQPQTSAAQAAEESPAAVLPAKEVPVWEPVPTRPSETAAPADAFRDLGVDRPAPAAPVGPPAPAPIAPWATPLVFVNGLFDWCLLPLGPVGRFLGRRRGRLGLALVGAACLVAAAVLLFVDWIGWTS